MQQNKIMKNILVPIGSSENASNTLQYAIDFATKLNAEVFVFRAYKAINKAGAIKTIDEFIERESKLYIRTIINSINKKEVSVKIITANGTTLDRIKAINKNLGIDLIILGPKSNSTKDTVFLGNTSGSIVKQTDIPTLIVPESYSFKPVSSILMAFKSGILNKENVLNPLNNLIDAFEPKVNLLHVKTPEITSDDLILDSKLEAIKTSLIITESATTFQGVLTHILTQKPDMLCVFRRKRGFFKILWEKNSIYKKEFNCKVPLLVLSGKK